MDKIKQIKEASQKARELEEIQVAIERAENNSEHVFIPEFAEQRVRNAVLAALKSIKKRLSTEIEAIEI
ncbi:hypothetical protein [Dyadobacter frigoris]|uniref:Uncharacterized protein n=1 Tax=Dyadobacter frigoris TaxID=2576211 RepID=A0A4V6BID0_9BACT|nr:hypothetical protein [Dyadobacter frigoris]TKT89483.1 hypothetical protein FDK13_24380 [Dyadobacter frigoris]